MEYLRGRRSLSLDRPTLLGLVAPYHGVHIDLGTGDGRYVLRTAPAHPDRFIVGVDACRDNLQRPSHLAPPNALFVIANVLSLPGELEGLACHISILFPWGSLLTGLLDGDARLFTGLSEVTRPHASLEVLLNAGALAEQGRGIEAGAARVRVMVREAGFMVEPPRLLDAAALRGLPSTWAKRLAFGRDPRAIALSARRADTAAAGIRQIAL